LRGLRRIWGGKPKPYPSPTPALPKCYAFREGVSEGRGGLEWKTNMPPRRSTPNIMKRAGELRKEPSPAEVKLWTFLRTQREDGIHFRRQHAIGPYVADFCAPRSKLIVEVDGSQYLDKEDYDAERTIFLESRGFRVLRFWNSDVMNNINRVMGVIREELERSNP
jgi:very-short-patch-repair endonuclease